MQEYDDDEAVEDYYFSAAAGRARIVLGNRRFGENGYVSSGRAYARPAQNTNTQVSRTLHSCCLAWAVSTCFAEVDQWQIAQGVTEVFQGQTTQINLCSRMGT